MYKDISNAYGEFWVRATDFRGTTSRADWWWVQLVNLIISVLTIPIFFRTFGFNVYGVICLVPQIAIDIRRLRDFGKDWRWIFINLIPIVGWLIWFLWLGFGGSCKNKDIA